MHFEESLELTFQNVAFQTNWSLAGSPVLTNEKRPKYSCNPNYFLHIKVLSSSLPLFAFLFSSFSLVSSWDKFSAVGWL